MTSPRERKLAREIQRSEGIKYTEALRRAQASIKARKKPIQGASPSQKLARLIQRSTPGLDYAEALRRAVLQIQAEEESFTNTSPIPRLFPPAKTKHRPFAELFPRFPLNDTEVIHEGLHYGTRENGHYAKLDLDAEGHLLCAGNAGKTNFLQNTAFMALRLESLYEVSVITAKPDEFKFAEPFARAVAGDLEEAVALLRALEHESTQRQEVREMYGAKAFLELPVDIAHREGLRSRRHILIIDGLFDLLSLREIDEVPEPFEPDYALRRAMYENDLRKEIAERIERIIHLGNREGISIVGATTKLLGDVPNALTALAQNSASFILLTPSIVPGVEASEPVGRGTFKSITGQTYRVQTWAMLDEYREEQINDALKFDPSDNDKFNLYRFSDSYENPLIDPNLDDA